MAEDRTKVLIIEDDEYSAEAYAHLLAARGYESEWMSDPRLGYEKAEQMRPDVILLDLSMPGMDGRDLIRLIRANATLEATPILVITGRDREVAESAVALGADTYLTKPVELSDLLGALTALNAPPPEP